MTADGWDILLYCGALFVLFATPGPVWLAVMARAVSGGFGAAWPLALGVAVGDVVWPFVAILGVSWMVSEVAGLMEVLRYVACVMFVVLGVQVVRHAGDGVRADSALTRPGRWAGFLAGVAVILSNPKAILFYMGVLPGFFDLRAVTAADIAVIVALSFTIPLLGNLVFAAAIDRLRRHVLSDDRLRRINLLSGGLLICVGVVIALT